MTCSEPGQLLVVIGLNGFARMAIKYAVAMARRYAYIPKTYQIRSHSNRFDRVIAIDIADDKLFFAEKLGVERIFRSDQPDLIEVRTLNSLMHFSIPCLLHRDVDNSLGVWRCQGSDNLIQRRACIPFGPELAQKRFCPGL